MFLPPNLQRKNGPHKTSMIRVRPLKAAIIWQILSCDKYNNPGFWVVIPKTTNATPVVKKKVAVSTPNNEEWYQWRCIPATRLITAPECWSNPIDSNLIKQFYFFEVIVIHNSCWQGKARKTNGVAPHASAALVPQTTIAVWQFLQKKGRNPDINHLQKPSLSLEFPPTQKIPLCQDSFSHWILIYRLLNLHTGSIWKPQFFWMESTHFLTHDSRLQKNHHHRQIEKIKWRNNTWDVTQLTPGSLSW